MAAKLVEKPSASHTPRRRTQRERNASGTTTFSTTNNLPIVVEHGLRSNTPQISSTQCARFGQLNGGSSKYYSPAGMREISFITEPKAGRSDSASAVPSQQAASSKDEPIYNPQCPKQLKLLQQQQQQQSAYGNYRLHHGSRNAENDGGKKNNGDVVEFNENEKNEYVIDEKKLRTDNLEVQEVPEDSDAETELAKHRQQQQKQQHYSGERASDDRQHNRNQQHQPKQSRSQLFES